MKIILFVFMSLCLICGSSFADSLSDSTYQPATATSQSSPSQAELPDLLRDMNSYPSSLGFDNNSYQVSFQGQCTDDDDCGTWKCCSTSCENVDVCMSLH